MKRTRILIILCLLTAMLIPLFTACGDPTNTDTTVTTTGDGPKSYTVNGYWYSHDEQIAVWFGENGAAKQYMLQPGYYEYGTVDEASYTIDGDGNLSLTVGADTYDYVYNRVTDALVYNAGTSFLPYERKTGAPVEHAVYNFPDFSKIDISFMELKGYKELEIDYNAARINGVFNCFNDYYEVYSEDDYPEILEDRAAVYGDFIHVSYDGYIDGKAFVGGYAEDYDLQIVADANFIPGFVLSFEGHKVGDQFDANLKFPDDYWNPDVAGKDVTFKMTLKAIYDQSLTDDAVKEYTSEKYATYEELLENYVHPEIENQIWEQLENSIDFKGDFPVESYQYFFQYYLDYYHYLAFQYGMDYESLLSYYQIDESYIRTTSQRISLGYLIPCVISKAESLNWSQEDYDKKFNEMVQDTIAEMECTEEEAKDYVEKYQLNYIRAELLYDAVNNWLLDLYVPKK